MTLEYTLSVHGVNVTVTPADLNPVFALPEADTLFVRTGVQRDRRCPDCACV